MKISSNSFNDGDRIPERCAFGKPNPSTHVELSDNKNPHLAFSDVPAGAKSLVVVCVDGDVPSKPDHVNREDVTVPASLPRVDFYHWVLIDIPPDTRAIAEGSLSNGITPRGKSGPDTARRMRHGLNNYTDWFAGDPDMAGQYFGYDGPCPPWNDEIVHHYRFRAFALDVARCPVEGAFSAPEVLRAIEGHVLAEATLTGTYAIYPHAK